MFHWQPVRHPRAPQQKTPLLDYGACSSERRYGHKVPDFFVFFFFSSSKERSAEGPLLEGVVSVANVHMNLASIQPQAVVTTGILQEVVLWGSVEGSTFVRYHSAE